MMKRRKLMSAVLCAAMAGTLLSGCGGGSKTEATTTAQAGGTGTQAAGDSETKAA